MSSTVPDLASSRASTRLVLVRHAQHNTSVDDGGLTRLGERQAQTLTAVLDLRDVVAVVASRERRAMATAAVLRESFAIVPGLEELDFGPEAPGTAEVVEKRLDLTLWKSTHGFPGGETLGAFQSRVAATMDKLVSDHLGSAVVAVTHSGFIDAALRWAYGQSPIDDWVTEAVLPNASVSEIEHWPSGRMVDGAPRFTVVHRIGDVSHLPSELVTEI